MSNLQKLSKNINGRDFIVGDIHGSYGLLIKKLEEVNFDFNNDRLFSVGDIINKGIDSSNSIKLLDEDWFYPVLGNHEWILLEYHHFGNYLGHMIKYNGHWFLEKNLYEREEIIEKVEKIPVAIELDVGDKKIGIVHAEVPYDNWKTFIKELGQKNPEKLIAQAIWSRDKIDNNDKTKVKGIDQVYVGHTIVEDIYKLSNVNYIDTGAFYYGKMELINLTETYKDV